MFAKYGKPGRPEAPKIGMTGAVLSAPNGSAVLPLNPPGIAPEAPQPERADGRPSESASYREPGCVTWVFQSSGIEVDVRKCLVDGRMLRSTSPRAPPPCES